MEPPTKTRKKAYSPRAAWRRRSSGKARLLGAVLVIALVLAGLFVLVRKSGESPIGRMPPSSSSKSSVLELWQKSDWSAVIAACDKALTTNTLDSFYLGMRGLALFYGAMDQPEGGSRTSRIEMAIVSIRKAQASQDFSGRGRLPRGELEYVLSKAYFHKGQTTRDLAAKYMEASLSHGFTGKDAHEYLAMSYSSLGQADKSLVEFERAMKVNDSGFLKIAAAQEYASARRPQEAERLLLSAIGATKDVIAREKARLLLVGDYFTQSRLGEAEFLINAILAENPDSAEGHFRLGLLFQARGDPVHARAEWRKAVALDPMHTASRQKLAERL